MKPKRTETDVKIGAFKFRNVWKWKQLKIYVTTVNSG